MRKPIESFYGCLTNKRLAHAFEQTNRFLGTLGRRHFQPVARLNRLGLARLTVVARQLQLGTQIAGTGGLAQQFQANATITGIATVATQQLPQTTLRHNHTLTRRLLEHASGDTLDAGMVAETRAIEQPQG